MNNSRFSVYRGDFRKSIKACEFTHVGVFMQTRRGVNPRVAFADIGQETPVHTTLCICRLCIILDHYNRVHFVPLEILVYIFQFSKIYKIFGGVFVVLITPAAAQSATWCLK